jgi:iron complex outermembrane recepter protein
MKTKIGELIMRTIVAALASLFVAGLCIAAESEAAVKKTTDIPAQSLERALQALAKEYGVQMVYRSELIRDRETQGVAGELTSEEALRQLLRGTGLTYRYIDGKMITIIASEPLSSQAPPWETKDGGASSGASVRVAQAGEDDPNNRPSDESATKSDNLEEIVVTAQKRVERLQDVPVPVSVISGSTLAETSQVRLQDYFQKVPGLGLAITNDAGEPTPSIRGIATGGLTAPVTGIVVDEISYGATAGGGLTVSVPDIDPGDIARIEVLRGPQGALYGASAMGGLLKYVTPDPSLERTEGRIEVGTSKVRYGNDAGYTLRGGVSVPLSDALAVRASGFAVRTPGYIDNRRDGSTDIDRRDSEGGRLTLLWAPSPAFSVKLGASIQDSRREGLGDYDITLGSDPAQSTTPGSGIYERKSAIYSATVKGTIAGVSLVSATGYSEDRLRGILDNALLVPFLGHPLVNVTGYSAVTQPLQRGVDKFSQEIRAEISLSDKMTLLAGGFYTQEDVSFHYDYYATSGTTGERGPLVLFRVAPSSYREYAGFSTLTVQFTDQFDLQVGGRAASNRQKFSEVRTGLFAPIFFQGANPSIVTTKESSETALTYLVTPRFRISPNLMAYARLASGYRPGGPNSTCGALDVPCDRSADKTQNYELGLKGSAFEDRFSFDISAYHIDWRDIQLTALTSNAPVFSYVANVGTARSRGLEVSLEVRPWTGMSISGWLARNDAEIAKNLATGSILANKGDRLPYTSPWSGNLSLTQRLEIAPDWGVTLGGSVDFVGERMGLIRGSLVRPVYPSYKQLDLRAGVEHSDWRLNAYATNVTDERGILRGGIEAVQANFFTHIQPRTIGLSLSRDF